MELIAVFNMGMGCLYLSMLDYSDNSSPVNSLFHSITKAITIATCAAFLTAGLCLWHSRLHFVALKAQWAAFGGMTLSCLLMVSAGILLAIEGEGGGFGALLHLMALLVFGSLAGITLLCVVGVRKQLQMNQEQRAREKA
jgi:hypothetical protein